jgi:hypothetical protein
MGAAEPLGIERTDRCRGEPDPWQLTVPHAGAYRLALIVGAARSGTTLSRLLLDAHPAVGCPSEAGLPALMGHLGRVWLMVNSDVVGGDGAEDPGALRTEGDAPARWEAAARVAEHDEQRTESGLLGELPESARAWIVRTVQGPMEGYCQRHGKQLYCDKSLDSVYYLPLVLGLFPEVRVVLVFRHVMDTIASGIEASPWGFQAYGYTPYVQATPGNSVAALASYWLDHVGAALSWESEHPEVCHRVRYEDLVLRPEETVAGMQRFLGVEEDLSVLARAFDRRPPRGPGDYKVEHTAGVHAGSIGHGKRVPFSMLPPPLVNALNEKLEALGYDLLDRGWNAAERQVDGGGIGLWAGRLHDLMCSFTGESGQPDVGTFAVVAEDHRALRWVIDPMAGTIEQGDGEVESVLTGTAEDLVLMLTAEENLGVLLRSGRVRHVVADEDEASRRDLLLELNELIKMLRRGIVDSHGDEVVALPGPLPLHERRR